MTETFLGREFNVILEPNGVHPDLISKKVLKYITIHVLSVQAFG
jgi:hypothetical protein